MAPNSQNQPRKGKKAATRAYRPTHQTAKLIEAFEVEEQRVGSHADEYLVELGLAVYLANDHSKYRLPVGTTGQNVN